MQVTRMILIICLIYNKYTTIPVCLRKCKHMIIFYSVPCIIINFYCTCRQYFTHVFPMVLPDDYDYDFEITLFEHKQNQHIHIIIVQ